jgi:hypothetical protein
VLPKPLRAPKDPVVSAFVAHYPETNFGVNYYEGALFVGAEFRESAGSTVWRCRSTTTRR